jgi:predicted TIM-barrel fold metal-dependent hydrolase
MADRPLTGAFDVHQHHGTMESVALPEGHGGRSASKEEWAQTERQVRMAAMDKMGITRAAILASNSYLQPNGVADTRRINDEIAAYCDADPKHFPVGIGTVEPMHGAAGLDEIRRIATLGLRGISYHTRLQGVTIDSVWIRRHIDLIAELRLVPLIHINVDSAFESPILLLRLARDFPGVPMIALDALSSYQHTVECELVAEACPEVVFETSQAYGNVVAAFASTFGAERVLFGSNLYSHPVAWRTANTPDAVTRMLDDEEKAADVLWRNADRLFGLEGEPREGGA